MLSRMGRSPALLGSALLAACVVTPRAQTAPPVAPPPQQCVAAPVVVPAPTAPASYTVDASLPTWGSGFAGALMSDSNPATYWCSPSGPTYPIATSITLGAPMNVADIDFDTRVPNYDTSAVRDVLLQPMAGTRRAGPSLRVGLHANDVTSVPVRAANVTSIEITFLTNFGGPYAALSELTVRAIAGSGRPPLPAGVAVAVAPAAQSTRAIPYVADALIPTYSAGYAASMMGDDVPSTYWCSPASPSAPLVTTLQLSAPTQVRGLTFNTIVPGYSDSSPHKVTLDALDSAGHAIGSVRGRLPEYAITTVSFHAPLLASAIRVTMHDNHGGQYFALTELVVEPP